MDVRWRPLLVMVVVTHLVTWLAERSEALSYPAMMATPSGPRAVSSATIPVRAGVAFGLVVKSDGSATAPLAGGSTDQPASHGPR